MNDQAPNTAREYATRYAPWTLRLRMIEDLMEKTVAGLGPLETPQQQICAALYVRAVARCQSAVWRSTTRGSSVFPGVL